MKTKKHTDGSVWTKDGHLLVYYPNIEDRRCWDVVMEKEEDKRSRFVEHFPILSYGTANTGPR